MTDRLPDQGQLDAALALATSLRIWNGNTDKKRRRRPPEYHRTTVIEEIRSLAALLRINEDPAQQVDIPVGWGP